MLDPQQQVTKAIIQYIQDNGGFPTTYPIVHEAVKYVCYRSTRYVYLINTTENIAAEMAAALKQIGQLKEQE